MVSVLLMLYYFLFMLGSVRQDKKRYAPFLGPLTLFIPHLYDEAGNKARLKFAIYLVAFLMCFGATGFFIKLIDQLK